MPLINLSSRGGGVIIILKTSVYKMVVGRHYIRKRIPSFFYRAEATSKIMPTVTCAYIMPKKSVVFSKWVSFTGSHETDI